MVEHALVDAGKIRRAVAVSRPVKRILLAMSAVVMMATGCANTAKNKPVVRPAPTPRAVAAPAPAPTPKPQATMDMSVVDGSKVDAATVILRVERTEVRGGDKYHWDVVRPLQTLKNDSDETFNALLNVAHYGWNKGVPAGTSTIYLEAFGKEGARTWRLLGSDGALGVSHSQP